MSQALTGLKTWLYGLAVAFLLAGTVGAPAALAQEYGWRKRTEPVPSPEIEGRPYATSETAATELALKAPADSLGSIEAGYENDQGRRLGTKPITDILVRIRHAVRAPPGRGHPAPSEGERSFVEVELLVVISGRISPMGLARCDRFDADVLACAVECGGGMFGLRRGQQKGEHFLVIGVADPDAARAVENGGPSVASPGFRLGSCAPQSGARLLLMPRGGRLASEVRLLEQR